MKKNLAVPLLNGALLSVAVHATAVSTVASPQSYLLDKDRVDADVRISLSFNLSDNFQDPTLDNLDYVFGFGASVALDAASSETRMIVGMPVAGVSSFDGGQDAQDGRIFIYELDSSGQVVQEIPTTLSVIDAIGQGTFGTTGVRGRRFGRAIDADGGYLIVSLREDAGDAVGAGVVLAEWDASAGVLGDYVPKTRIFRPVSDVDAGGAVDFGAAVQVNSSHTIIGVPDLEVGSTVSGAVFTAQTSTILGSGGTVSEVDTASQSIKQVDSPSPATGGQFGHSAALAGNLLVVGAPGETSGSVLNAGRAHVYQWSGTEWTILTSLDPSTAVAEARYGYSCDIVIDGNETIIVVGAPADTDTDRSGLVEVWRRVGSNPFTREAVITDGDALDPSETRLPYSSFGFSVKALDKDNIVIGRVNSYDLRNGNQHDPDEGSEAFVETGSGTTVYPYGMEPSAYVFRYDASPAQWDVYRPLVPSRVNTTRSWAGWSMDAIPNDTGYTVVLGDPLGSSLQPGLGSAFLFDSFADPIDEYNAVSGTFGTDGTSDAWQIKQDIEVGFPDRLDLNGDGRVDAAPTTDECLRQIVLIVDVSGSTVDFTYLEEIFQLADNLDALFSTDPVEVTVLGLGVPFEVNLGGTLRTPAGDVNDLSNIVPREGDGITPWVPALPPVLPNEPLGDPGRTGVRFIFERSDFALDDDDESWGPAVSIVAEHFPWRSNYRVIVPISDESAFRGDGGAVGSVTFWDYESSDNANGVAFRNGVRVFPIITPFETAPSPNFSQSALDCASLIVGEVGFQVSATNPLTGTPQSFGLSTDPVGDVFVVSDKSILSEQGIAQGGVSNLAASLVALAEPVGCSCPGDANGDGAVDLADLNLVLANFGQMTTSGDVTGDGVVDLADLNLVLANFGTDCNEGESKSFSMSMTDPEELPVTIWLMLKDHPNADSWIDHIGQFEPGDQAEDTNDLKEWVDDWEGGTP